MWAASSYGMFDLQDKTWEPTIAECSLPSGMIPNGAQILMAVIMYENDFSLGFW